MRPAALTAANAAATTPANARHLTTVITASTRVLSVRPAMLRSASTQMMTIGSSRPAAFADGHSTIAYSDMPDASAAATPGSMISSDCQP